LIYDLAIIGGGINGCGIARDAAGRGLSVFLCEQNDLGGATSSASSKLIHGGLRYLESFEFRLVRESLIEREVLLRIAPHIVRPLRLVLPHHAGLRPRWLLRLGLFLYDHLGGKITLPPTANIDLTRDPSGSPLKPEFIFGFEYSDCTVDDSRMVVLNALDAKTHGAHIVPHTRCVSAERERRNWRLLLEPTGTKAQSSVSARALINVAGPWVNDVSRQVLKQENPLGLRRVKGSHIVLPRLFDHDRAYIFQNADRRIIFAIPYQRDFTLIGTTEEDFVGDPFDATISEDETNYLCMTASKYFRIPVSRDEIVWAYAGVRALRDDGTSSARKASRGYHFVLEQTGNQAPLLTVHGGKITSYRRLAEDALARLTPFVGEHPPWTASAPLPGGDVPRGGIEALLASLIRDYPFLARSHVERLVNAYGTRASAILNNAREASDLGQWFHANLTEAEIRYLVAEEWAMSAADILWRRSKLGLWFGPQDVAAVEKFLVKMHSESKMRTAPQAGKA
jgi:glycerol-3-phosphate dehydrogenase